MISSPIVIARRTDCNLVFAAGATPRPSGRLPVLPTTCQIFSHRRGREARVVLTIVLGGAVECLDVNGEGAAMSWQKETHEKRLDRFEQRLLSAQFDSKIVTCRSRAGRVRATGSADSMRGGPDSLADRRPGTADRRSRADDHQPVGGFAPREPTGSTDAVTLRARVLVDPLLWAARGRLGDVLRRTPDAISRTSHARQDFSRSGHDMHALSVR